MMQAFRFDFEGALMKEKAGIRGRGAAGFALLPFPLFFARGEGRLRQSDQRTAKGETEERGMGGKG